VAVKIIFGGEIPRPGWSPLIHFVLGSRRGHLSVNFSSDSFLFEFTQGSVIHNSLLLSIFPSILLPNTIWHVHNSNKTKRQWEDLGLGYSPSLAWWGPGFHPQRLRQKKKRTEKFVLTHVHCSSKCSVSSKAWCSNTEWELQSWNCADLQSDTFTKIVISSLCYAIISLICSKFQGC
jgi:hypothetical protein